MINKPIFIIGIPRSGTTFLYDIILAHPDVSWFTSYDLVDLIPSSQHEGIITNWKKLKFEIGQVPQTEENFFASMAYRKSRGEFIPKPIAIEGEVFWREFFGTTYTENISDTKKNELISKLEKFISKNQKPRFLNKAPQNCMRLFALKKCFPDAKFIHIYRDPRSVIASSIVRDSAEGIFDPGINVSEISEFQEKSQVEKWAWFYKVTLNYILNFAKKQSENNFFTVKYEELLSNPKKIVTEVLNFSELIVPDSITDLIPPIKNTYEKWKEKLSEEDVEVISKILKPTLQEMDFSYNF